MINIQKNNFKECFEYRGGCLIWKNRPRSHFSSNRSHSATNSNFAGKVAGSPVTSNRSKTIYIGVSLCGENLKAHRIVWEMMVCRIPKGLVIDNIDGDGQNNKLDNLRLVTQSGNQRNSPMKFNNKTGVVGVNWHKGAKKWQARIQGDFGRVDLGRFDNFNDAVAARKSAELEFGYHKNHGR